MRGLRPPQGPTELGVLMGSPELIQQPADSSETAAQQFLSTGALSIRPRELISNAGRVCDLSQIGQL